MIVLSQLRTLTVVSAISMTSPSAAYLGISNQSSTDRAPKPFNKISGDLPIKSEIANKPINILAINLMV
mgnify:CR=1 FL=1